MVHQDWSSRSYQPACPGKVVPHEGMRLVQATKREVDVSKRTGAVPGDSGADGAVSHSGESDNSDVKIIPADRLERARAKKYGYSYASMCNLRPSRTIGVE
jgi:hypothetical protein